MATGRIQCLYGDVLRTELILEGTVQTLLFIIHTNIQTHTPTSLSSRLSRSIFLLTVIQLSLIICITSAYAAQVTLGWSPGTEPDLAGYKVYYGTASRNYTQSVDINNRTATSCTITNLTEGQTYYFAATAYNTSLVESPHSAEVSWHSQLSSFYTIPGNKIVKLIWVTAKEIDNAVFDLYRAEDEDGQYTKINDVMIPPEVSEPQGASYEFIDTDVMNRMTYYYKLAGTDLNGKPISYGPESATPLWIYWIFGDIDRR
jgi:hypothetical protein